MNGEKHCIHSNSITTTHMIRFARVIYIQPQSSTRLMIKMLFQVAESVADTLARADGREIRLEEEPTLGLALLLPDDGYSCEVIRGVPAGLAEFLAPLQHDGLCRMAPQPTSSGFWTIYMIDHNTVTIPQLVLTFRSTKTIILVFVVPQPERHEQQIVRLFRSRPEPEPWPTRDPGDQAPQVHQWNGTQHSRCQSKRDFSLLHFKLLLQLRVLLPHIGINVSYLFFAIQSRNRANLIFRVFFISTYSLIFPIRNWLKPVETGDARMARKSPKLSRVLFDPIFDCELQGAGQDKLGIYIKSVVAGGAADAVS